MRGDRSAAYAAFVLRISLAYFFAAHLYVKFAILGVDTWWSSLEKAGYAAWVPYYTVVAEFAGAILLLLGIYSRYVALLALPVLIAVTRHWAIRKGLWFVDGGAEFPLAWTLMLVVQAILGDGAFAVKVPAPPWERGRRHAAMIAGE